MSAEIARATAQQVCQIGVEAAPGTPVAATTRLVSTAIRLSPKPAIAMPTPVGIEVPAVATRGKEYSEGTIEGALSYTEVPYLLGSLLTNAGGTTYKPGLGVPTINTLTVENGDAGRAERFDYVVVSGLRFRFTREEAAISGACFGREVAEGAVLTAAATPTAVAPVNPDKVQVLIGDSVAGLTAIDQIDEAEVSIDGRWAPRMTLDPAEASYSDIVLKQHNPTAQLVLPHGADAAGWIDDLRAAATRFCQIWASEEIGGVTYTFQVTFPFVITGDSRGDSDGVWASTFDLALVYDATFGSWIEVVVTAV